MYLSLAITPISVGRSLVGMTHHYSWAGVYGTDSNTVNDLTPNVGDPNSFIPEYKAFLVNIEKA